MTNDIKNLGSFVWSIAETLRGDFKQSEYCNSGMDGL